MSDKNQNNKKWILLGSGLVCFGILKLGLLWWWQAHHHQHNNPKITVLSGCLITEKPCVFAQNSQIQLLNVQHNHTPFSIRITGAPPQTQTISASFSMPNMDMGFNQFNLKKQDNNGTWLAENIHLPVCTQARHDWQIDWRVDGQNFQTTFQTQ